MQEALALPETLALYDVSDSEDHLVHVAAAGSTELQTLIIDRFLALHRHEQAGTYCVLAGEGTFAVEGAEHSVRAGSTAFISASSAHGIRGTGPQSLRFFYVLAADDFTDVGYGSS